MHTVFLFGKAPVNIGGFTGKIESDDGRKIFQFLKAAAVFGDFLFEILFGKVFRPACDGAVSAEIDPDFFLFRRFQQSFGHGILFHE